VTDYLNDVQPGLVKLLRQDDGSNVEHFVHAPRGIHAVDDSTDWNFYAQDGLGSVRALVDDMAVVQTSMSFDPYGNPMASYGDGFGFTGEQTDENGSLFLRARYMNPNMGTFLSLDPFEGKTCTPMSLNGYGWVHGNPITNTDPTGMTCCDEYKREPVAYRACLANSNNQHNDLAESTITPTGLVPPITQSVRDAIQVAEPGGCTSSSTNRSACALQVYDALNDAYGQSDALGKRMQWDIFLGAVLHSEAENLYVFEQIEGEENPRDVGVRCYRRGEEQPMSNCDELRLNLENTIVQNLRAFCMRSNYLNLNIQLEAGGYVVPDAMFSQFTTSNDCTGAEVLYWLAGIPGAPGVPPTNYRVSGVQGIYQLAQSNGGVNFEELGDSNETPNLETARFNVDGFDRRMREAIGRPGQCPGCTWGTVAYKPTTPYYVQYDIETPYGGFFELNTIGS
jgi:RHS repeat-associated protein